MFDNSDLYFTTVTVQVVDGHPLPVRAPPRGVTRLLLTDQIRTHRQPLEVVGSKRVPMGEKTGARVAPRSARIAPPCMLDIVGHFSTSPQHSGSLHAVS